MKNEDDLVEKANKAIKRIKNGNVFTMDLKACRLIEEMQKEIIKLRGLKGEKRK